jgi:hypothetical protein
VCEELCSYENDLEILREIFAEKRDDLYKSQPECQWAENPRGWKYEFYIERATPRLSSKY